MPIIKWEPMNDIERILDDGAIPMFPRLGWDLAVDVYEQKGNVIAKMSLPGVDVQDVDIALDTDTLVISGSRQEEHKTEEKDYFSKEIRRGSFSRIVQLPKSVDSANTTADYADGVLVVTMPVVKGKHRKPVTVKVKKS